MPLLASFLFFLEPTAEPASDAAPPPAAVEAPVEEAAVAGAPRRVGMVLGEDGPRALLEGPDGNIYVGAPLSGVQPADDREVLDERLTMLLGPSQAP